MTEPTKEQIQWFWEQCGAGQKISGKIDDWMMSGGRMSWKEYKQRSGDTVYPPIDLNNLFLYAPDIIVGIYFRYYPGGCECELTYITEAGFDTEKSWVKNETDDEKKSRELSALALFEAIYKAFGGK